MNKFTEIIFTFKYSEQKNNVPQIIDETIVTIPMCLIAID